MSTRLRFSALIVAFALSLGGAVGAAAVQLPPTPGLAELTRARCAGMDSQIAGFQRRFVAPMQRWSRTELANLKSREVLYLFSGPDIVTALAMFPDATGFTLVADQVPEYQLLYQAETPSAEQISRECGMNAFFARTGFYRTRDLIGSKGMSPRFLQLLLYSIAFSGATVSEASLISVSSDGRIAVLDPRSHRDARGVRFIVRRADGRPARIDYLAMDLSNSGLAKAQNDLELLRRLNSGTMFLKSASHLLQSINFTMLAKALSAAPAPAVVQDETGFGIDRLHKDYEITRYGAFTKAQKNWEDRPSARALAEDFAKNPPKSGLPFRIGYEKESGSVLLVARRR